ncbi:MAG: phage tail tube protein [Alphaproteobacteria bacterium]
MSVHKGSSFLLKIYLDDEQKYKTLGGLYTTKFYLKNSFTISEKIGNTNWLELANTGSSSLSISATGIYTSCDSEHKIRQYAFSRKIHKYQLVFGNGEIIKGSFIISDYQREGNVKENENYSLSFLSTGDIEFLKS